MIRIVIALLMLYSPVICGQDRMFTLQEVSVNELLNGTLFSPSTDEKTTLAIIIAGSGPTDRDGNQVGMINNSLKYLAEGLAENGISVYSYDKRIIAQLKSGDIDESKLSFEDFINDAVEVAEYFKNQNKFKNIVFIGHSEGALIGTVATKKAKVGGFVSLAGAGNPIDKILEFQMKFNLPQAWEEAQIIITELKKGNTIEVKNPYLISIFNPGVQPYMISWMKYNPQEEIKKLEIPVMIIGGTKDIQVRVSEAELLQKAKPEAKYLIVENMNHLLKEIKGSFADNHKSYNNPDLPVMPELIQEISDFVKGL